MNKGTFTTLEITDTHVKLLQAKGQGSVPVVSCCLVRKIQDGAEKTVAEILIKLLPPKDIDPESLTVIVPRRHAILKKLSLPSHTDEELRRMVDLQIPGLVPYSRDEMIYDYQILEKDPSGYTRVLAVIVPKETVNRWIRMVSAAGIHPHKFALSSQGVSFWFAVQAERIQADAQIPVLLLDVGPQQTEICICQQQKLLFSRQINFGSRDLAAEALEDFVEQIGLTLGAYKKERWGADVQRIALVSSAKEISVLREKLHEYYHLPIDSVSALDHLPCEKDLDLREWQAAGAVPITAHLGFLLSDGPMMNLMPQEVLRTKFLRLKQKVVFRFALAALATVLLGVGTFGVGVFHNEGYVKDLERKLKDLKPKVEEAQRKFQYLQFAKERLQTQVLAVDVLKEIYHLTPDDVTLSAFQLDSKGGLSVQGMAQAGSSVSIFQNGLVKSALFDDVKLQYATKRRRFQDEYTDFKITFHLIAPKGKGETQ